MNKYGPEFVPCKHCGNFTSMTGTKTCDRCYELEKRIGADPVLAAKILKEIQK